MKAYVIGQPISHSLSPDIFRVISEVEESELNYSKLEVAPENLSSQIEQFKNDDDFVGANVTLPHKEEVIKFASELSAEVKAIGAANVISLNRGKLKASNTDIVGIRKTLESKGFTIPGKTALLVGAGGSARAVAYVLGEAKAKEIIIYNPRSDRGDALCKSMGDLFSETLYTSVREVRTANGPLIDLVVNCTPIGMKNEENSFFDELKKLNYSKNALAFDLLYTPRNTLFLRVMRERKLNLSDGLPMLIEQALASWEIWIGRLGHAEELREKLKYTLSAILRAREDDAPIFLTGFMGVGKSTVARELSYLLHRSFLDTDRAIEEEAHATVPEIFERFGENRFRELERESILKAINLKHSVIALGGGALNSEECLREITGRGILIYLKASEQTLFKRLKKRAHDRPLLADAEGDQLKEKISELLEKRIPLYQRAHFEVEVTADDTPYDSAQRVLKVFGGGR